MSSSSTALLIQIKQLVSIDLKSDKVTVRAKSLDEFHNIFDNRSRELSTIFRPKDNNNRMDVDNDDYDHVVITWSELFTSLHEAIKDQCMRIDSSRSAASQKSLIAKNDAYKEALRKCINLANEHIPNVPYTRICQTAFECFQTPSVRNYFDALYLQIVRRHILNARHSLSEIKISDWSRKFNICFI